MCVCVGATSLLQWRLPSSAEKLWPSCVHHLSHNIITQRSSEQIESSVRRQLSIPAKACVLLLSCVSALTGGALDGHGWDAEEFLEATNGSLVRQVK